MTLAKRVRAALRYFRSLSKPSPRRRSPNSAQDAVTIDLLNAMPDAKRVELQAKLYGARAAVASALEVAE